MPCVTREGRKVLSDRGRLESAKVDVVQDDCTATGKSILIFTPPTGTVPGG